MVFEIGWTPIGHTRGAPCFIEVPDHQGASDYSVGSVHFGDGSKFYFTPEQHAQVIRWFKWWFDDMVEH